MGYPVNAPHEIAAALVASSVSNITTTRQQVGVYPSGAKWVNLSYRLLPGATASVGQHVKIVVNASSDADADGRLATSGAFCEVFQGEDISFSAQTDSLITRVDAIAAVAVGTESTILRLIAGV